MLLVFALAAAICLRVFVYSSDLSVNGETMSHAVTAVQNAAESLKLSCGDVQKHAQNVGGTVDGEAWYQNYNELWQPVTDEKTAFTVKTAPVQTENALLGGADVWASDDDGNTLFRVTVYWQEENDG